VDLKDYSVFLSQIDWINYYLNRLAPIYQKQSQQDPLMSQSFDFFFKQRMNTSQVIFQIPKRQP
jgi:aspartyl/asparaginyl-tRNA synthetase